MLPLTRRDIDEILDTMTDAATWDEIVLMVKENNINNIFFINSPYDFKEAVQCLVDDLWDVGRLLRAGIATRLNDNVLLDNAGVDGNSIWKVLCLDPVCVVQLIVEPDQ